MGKRARIIVDAMGGDFSPECCVVGAVDALKEITDDIILVGNENQINPLLKKQNYDKDRLRVIHADDVIENTDSPVRAIKSKQTSSLVVAYNMLKNDEGDLLLSPGSSGAILAGGIFIIGRIDGIDRPALASIYPVFTERKFSLLLDAGVNSEVKPKNILDFAVMGSVFFERVFGVEKPKVAILNMGAEKEKGPMVLKEAYNLLEKSKDELNLINFIGNIEGRDVPNGACDVIVADGFSGNIILKLTEGLGFGLFSKIKDLLNSNIKTKMAGGLIAGDLKKLKNDYDYTEYGGAPLLGIKKPVIKMHGSTNAKGVKNAIIHAIPVVKNNMIGEIEHSLVEMAKLQIIDGGKLI